VPASDGQADPANSAPLPGDQLRVRPGDSLWLIAAQRLGSDSSDPLIAAEWPRWYAANRSVIGTDPSVIQPGQVLRAPGPPNPNR
jgi:nucleoid-associated protein YgaU